MRESVKENLRGLRGITEDENGEKGRKTIILKNNA